MTIETKRDIGRTGVAAGRLMLALAALTLAAASAFAAETASVPVAPEAGLSVSVKAARRICFEDSVEVTGTVVARQPVDIGPDREGLQVSQVLVEPLDAVTPGQVMARLTVPDGPGGAILSVRSPIAGIVGRSTAVVGTPATTRQALFQVMAGGTLDLQAEAPGRDLAKLAVGQPVTIGPLGLPDISGTVQSIGSAIDPQSQLGRLRVAISTSRDLRVGTFARGLIVVGRRCGIGIPYSSVMYQPDGTIVHVAVGNHVEARQVTIGLLSGADIEVRSGLRDGETVVTRAGPFLRDGEQIVPIPVPDSRGTPVAPAP